MIPSFLLFFGGFGVFISDELFLFFLVLSRIGFQFPLLILHNSPLLMRLFFLMLIDIADILLFFLQFLILHFEMFLSPLILLDIVVDLIQNILLDMFEFGYPLDISVLQLLQPFLELLPPPLAFQTEVVDHNASFFILLYFVVHFFLEEVD